MADKRKTVHLTEERHEEVVNTAFNDGRVRVRAFLDEAVAYYLELTPATRASFRRKLKRRMINEQ
jgi:hypothetical protein